MCTNPNNVVPAPILGKGTQDNDINNMDLSEEEGEVLESRARREDGGRSSRHRSSRERSLARSSSRSSSVSPGEYRRRGQYGDSGGRTNYYDYSCEGDDDDYCEKRRSYEYKRKYSEGSGSGDYRKRKKLKFIPPKKQVVRVLTSTFIGKDVEPSARPCRWGPRFVHAEQNQANGFAESNPTVHPTSNGTLGMRFQPRSSTSGKLPILRGGVSDMEDVRNSGAENFPSRWSAPSATAAVSATANSSRWNAPSNALPNASFINSSSRWVAPPTSVSNTSLSTTDPHHLPFKKRFYVDTSLTATPAACSVDHHPIVTTTEEEHSHAHLDSEGESLAAPEIHMKGHCGGVKTTHADSSNCGIPQLVTNCRIISKDESSGHNMAEYSSAPEGSRSHFGRMAPMPSYPFHSERGGVDKKEFTSRNDNVVTQHHDNAPHSPLQGRAKGPTESSFKKILSSVKPQSLTSTIHDLRISHDKPSSSLKKPPHIHIKLPKVAKSWSHESPASPGKAHIHIKLPKIAKSHSNDESSNSPGRKLKLKISCSPRSSKTDPREPSSGNKLTSDCLPPERKQGPPEPPIVKTESYPPKLHVCSMTSSQPSIESKAQQILAKARMRLQGSAGVEQWNDSTVALQSETQDAQQILRLQRSASAREQLNDSTNDARSETHDNTSFRTEPLRPAVLSESPVSVPNEDLFGDDAKEPTVKITASLEPNAIKDTMKPKAVRILHSKIHIPRRAMSSYDKEKASSSLLPDDSLLLSESFGDECAKESCSVKEPKHSSNQLEKKTKEMMAKPAYYSDTDSDALIADAKPPILSHINVRKSFIHNEEIVKMKSTKPTWHSDTDSDTTLTDSKPKKFKRLKKKVKKPPTQYDVRTDYTKPKKFKRTKTKTKKAPIRHRAATNYDSDDRDSSVHAKPKNQPNCLNKKTEAPIECKDRTSSHLDFDSDSSSTDPKPKKFKRLKKKVSKSTSWRLNKDQMFATERANPDSDSDMISVDPKPKKFKRLRKKSSVPASTIIDQSQVKAMRRFASSKSPKAKSPRAPKKKSLILSSLKVKDSDSSDTESSTDSSSSQCSTSSSSVSSSSSSTSTSSSSESESDGSSRYDSYSSSSSSSSSDSSTSSGDSDLSLDDDDSSTSHMIERKHTAKKSAKKPKWKHTSRRRSSVDVIMGPAPPKEQALTDMEIRRILQQDSTALGNDNSTWVRRSSRQPSKNLINSASVKDLLNRLPTNDSDMVVLKMKKYLNDPDLPPVVMNAALDALEENSNCQALYIQNFNNAMKDEQMLHLLRVLQAPKCRIWCLNIGETYNVSHKTWTKFAKGLKHTKVTHMYASEHTITAELKDLFRYVIRKNRQKHSMHIDPNNLDVIVKCTHCWWNPINASVLRPYIKNSEYEHILLDKETLGLKGTTNGKNADTI